jgi:lipoprotein-releasing system permease protein
MKLPLFIARRYFFSRHSATAVNILAGISITGLAIGTGALLVILAAFNGLEDLVKSFYASFDPDMKVEIRIGKNFLLDEEKINTLLRWEEITSVSPVLEERVLLRYRDQEFIASARGVDSSYAYTTGIAEAIYRGNYKVQHPDAVVGIGVAYNLGMSYVGRTETIEMFVPKASAKNLNRPERAFNQDIIYPAGMFSVQPEFDIRYVLTDLSRLQRMSEQEGVVSALEIKLAEGVRAAKVQEKLQAFFGDDFQVRNRIEQQAAFYKVMRAEGLLTYLIFTLILLISSFTLMGSLSMMILDKKKDLHTLWFLGMPRNDLRRVFFTEGLLITVAGACIGLFLGGLFTAFQHYFGLVTMGAGYVVEAYPVRLNPLDVAKVLATVLIIGLSISFLASRRKNIV